MQQRPILIPIQYPPADFIITKSAGKQLIWDPIRKKKLVLTPEEWVRQNFIRHLIKIKNYPASLLSIEKQIKIGSLNKRCDIVVYKSSRPWMIIECKEPKVPIDEKVMTQILNYNMTLQVPFLILTNGKQTCGVQRSEKQWQFISQLPEWE